MEQDRKGQDGTGRERIGQDRDGTKKEKETWTMIFRI